MKNGFTVIESLIVLAILGILLAVGIGACNKATGSSISWGANGLTEERCIAGYLHVVGEGGHARQVMNEKGQGIPCGRQ